MQFVKEFRNPHLAEALLAQISQVAERIGRTRSSPVTVMEVCGGHTHTIFRYGLDRRLPANIEFAHGPGCPVCVLPKGRIEDAIGIAHRPDVIFATFGDAMRVPGGSGSLLQARAAGADVRMVYSPLDALALARANPERQVVFFALGFETTAPSTALTVLRANAEKISNFTILCQHITIIPTLRALLEQPDFNVDGFIGPGHVSMVIGTQPYAFIAQDFKRPLVVAGFEPLDILQSLLMVLNQIEAGQACVENQYARVVAAQGNPAAMAAIDRVYEVRQACEWRGLGQITGSGLQLRPEWSQFDAEKRFAMQPHHLADLEQCRCGDVLTGRIKPPQCQAFGRGCSPDHPSGALMVSSEGACAAYYEYHGVGEAA
ncbi:hydrogenase formation protein HypD [Acetobacter lambici]|uniref:Hydrogenase maturation factor n=1 Tax=Acetobacter lambici TaxID=1332824 RepID=A0ABT1F0T3_9PROT|nr:hydrogenase formation protein HypD [Acetobacter lambici]MCP1242689.1 hydrogenase formation protein HypD [Acetobacter lambici]MCP1258822.1 hydrogenase formation protein HypD [Acetobacter lambici]NHO57131.1 hydrogenase formation protein HypD [Acetobacter lambici]